MKKIVLYDPLNKEITRCKKCGALLTNKEKLRFLDTCIVCEKK